MPLFQDFFRSLWGFEPFPWQAKLADRISTGTWPGALDLPTAAGKTACMDAAIWALASQAEMCVSDRTAPRRIWFVVDRRIVVDEAYERACRISEMLRDAREGPLKATADRLLLISGTERPLSVARLRGGIMRDDGWARIPSQPAIITSTVDQLGSRLLFRGYGRSHLAAPIFAGLAAHDSLILLDEAHCSVPFYQTLRAVERYRGSSWSEGPIKTPFAFAILSATPPPEIPSSAVFPGEDRDDALDHPVLRARMRASKPAELVVLKTRRSSASDPLVTEAVKRVKCYLEQGDKERLAVIVNRVRTAMEVAETLRADMGDGADVALLTGRLRPFERDRLVEKWKPFLRACDPEAPDRTVVLVSTQSIEVGADFSFDALVTEAASLDALRQRFGRLNRMGKIDSSPAVILIREEDTSEDTSDPIYGSSIASCWRLLDERASTDTRDDGSKVIDFGIDALDSILADVDDMSAYLAPAPDAPTLLPAHLDLLCQTAPLPDIEPDIQLFLHGVDRGAPETRVVWRADLDMENTESWEETVALCPPASTESLSVPLFRVRQWLSSQIIDRDMGDVEGASLPEDQADDGEETIRPALVWAGRERSRLARRAADIRPDDLVIVPAGYGMIPMGQSEPCMAFGRDQLDLWEVARVTAGRPAALRIHRDVLEPWLDLHPIKELVTAAEDPDIDRDSLQDAIEAILTYQPSADEDPEAIHAWLIDLLRQLRSGRFERHPGGGLVVFERMPRSMQDAADDLFADDDDILSATGQEVSLDVHCESVKRAVEKMACRCLDDDLLGPLITAAYWHDVGKLDDRFQILLHQGDELAAADGSPLAKSAEIPSSPARRRSIREASGLPRGFRHEMLSLQLAQRFASLPENKDFSDLVLHLISSHHGHGRPFAPSSPDKTPPSVRGTHFGETIDLSAYDRAALRAPHSLASGVSERFWSLTRKHGWWGLAYIEAIMRLGDWYGSQYVVPKVPDSIPGAIAATGSVAAGSCPENSVVLAGIDGANPLGFLAAVGTITSLHAAGHRDLRLSWKCSANWQPVLSGVPSNDSEYIARMVTETLEGAEVSEDAERRRKEAQELYDAARKAVREKLGEIKSRGIRGKEYRQAIDAEIAPLQEHANRCRQERQTALRDAVPRPELAIGKHIDCTIEEYREHVEGFLIGSGVGSREPLDFMAAFASDACLHGSANKRKEGILAPTPFCFISGSGHQYFLDTVRQLMSEVEIERVRAMLFEPWQYSDEKLSMRWDPSEDRRYALMDRDPTAGDNKSRTVWMANLLAYRGLALFASAPRCGYLATTGWRGRDEQAFTWPMWQEPAGLDTIRSLLLLTELASAKPDQSRLLEEGVVTTFRARRIRVGTGANFKINFSPSRRV